MLLAAVLGAPIYWMLVTVVQDQCGHQPAGAAVLAARTRACARSARCCGDPIFRDDLRNSLVITLAAVLISLVVGFFGALAIARFRFAGRKVFVFAVLVVQMIPLLALTIPISLLLDRFQLKNSLTGVVIAYLMFSMPYTVWTLRTFIAGIPRELDEAAHGRRVQPVADVLQDHPAAGRARADRHRRLRLDPGVERVRPGQHACCSTTASRRRWSTCWSSSPARRTAPTTAG